MNGTIISVHFKTPPVGRKLNFSLSVKGSKPGDGFAVVAIGVGDPKVKKLNWTMEWEDHLPLDATAWRVFRRTYVLTPDTTGLRFIIHNTSKNDIVFADPHMEVGPSASPDQAAVALAAKTLAEFEAEKAHPSDTIAQVNHDALAKQAGPVLVRVVMRAPLKTRKPGETGTITFPLPIRDGSQIPVGFKLTCDKSGKLLGFKWRRGDGGRLFCDAQVSPGTKGSWLNCESLVFVHAGALDSEKGLDEHLRSTACVQSADPRVAAVAKKLGEGVEADGDYVAKVFAFVRDNQGKGAPFKQLDALAALDCGGSCTNRANLSAALLRAHGIPARTIAHMPTWCDKLYEHWLTEYWNGKQWVAFDPSLGRLHPDRRTRVEFGAATSADEDRAFEKQHLRFVMPGAPYQSVCELSPTLYPADLAEDDAINWATQICMLPASSEVEAVSTAERRFLELFEAGSKGRQDVTGFDRMMAAGKRNLLTKFDK